MTEEERIRGYAATGAAPAYISRCLLIPVNEVRERMAELGIAINSRSRTISVWEMDETERRSAIARRASKAAKAQTEKNRKVKSRRHLPTLSTAPNRKNA